MKKLQSKKFIILIGAIVLVVMFLVFDLDRYLTLQYIKDSQHALQNLYSDNPVVVLSLYILVYVFITALSLPGAVVMTLAGGAVFGLIAGTIAVSIASTTGATLACFVSRFILRDWVQNRFGDKLQAINDGIEKEGGFYLFSVRLIPIFPFFIINLLMGLTTMPLKTFFWVSQLGMLPGTLVFVNAGKELGKIESASGILSPTLIASFIILGLFPITVRKILEMVKNRVTPSETKGVENGKI